MRVTKREVAGLAVAAAHLPTVADIGLSKFDLQCHCIGKIGNVMCTSVHRPHAVIALLLFRIPRLNGTAVPPLVVGYCHLLPTRLYRLTLSSFILFVSAINSAEDQAAAVMERRGADPTTKNGTPASQILFGVRKGK